MLHHGSTSHNWVVRVLLSINSFDEKRPGTGALKRSTELGPRKQTKSMLQIGCCVDERKYIVCTTVARSADSE